MKTNDFSKNYLGTFEGCRNGYGQAYFEFYGNRNLTAIFFKICTFHTKVYLLNCSVIQGFLSFSNIYLIPIN